MKKFLSLVLALVMTMSLVTISAGAKDFADDDKITYDEAVAVISEIGVVDGYTDGKFNPTNTLTRQAAAKIICNLILGPTTAAELHADTAPYKDVPTTSEFAGYIAYCAKEGIISGYADGTFKPGNTLTGYAFMKMLLGALGYDANYEQYVGSNWSINVAKQALGIGLNDTLEGEFNGIKAVTREEACLYAFNTLKSTMVAYDNKITANVNGAEVTISNTNAKPVTWKEGINEDGNIKADGFVQFAEEFFPKLVRKDDSTKFEEPANTWVYDKTEIGTFERKDLIVETYTEGVTGKDVYDLLKSGVIKDNDLESYVDGKANTIEKNDLLRSNNDDLDNTGDGVLTKIYLDTDKDLITIVSINTYLAQATADYNEKKEYAPLTVYVSDANGRNYNVDVEDVKNIADVKEDEFYQVNISYKDNATIGEVVIVNDVEILEDSTVTKFSTKNGYATKLTVSGTEYKANVKAFYDDEVLYEYNEDLLTDNTYNVFVDANGYFIGIELFEGTKNYVFIPGYDLNGSHIAVKTADASAIFLDGTMSTIKVNVTDTNKNIRKAINDAAGHSTGYFSIWANGDDQLNQWYTYTVDANGNYTLKPCIRMTHTSYAAGTDVIIRTDNLSLVANDPAGPATRVYGEDETVFLTVETDDVSLTAGNNFRGITEVNGVYTGVQNVDLEIETKAGSDAVLMGQVFTVYDSDYYVIGAVVLGEATGATGNYAYILSTAKYEERIDDTYYWSFDAILNGEIQHLIVESKYTNAITPLVKNTVMELRFTGEYVTNIKPVDADEEYTVNTVNIDGEDVYKMVDLVDFVSGTPVTTLNLQGNTMYITDNRSDVGLGLAKDAKAVVIQKENGKSKETEFTSVSAAIAHLADPDNNTANGLQCKGDIYAILESNGAAKWVVFNSDTELKTGTQTGFGGGGSDTTLPNSTDLAVTFTGSETGYGRYDATNGKLYLQFTSLTAQASKVDLSNILIRDGFGAGKYISINDLEVIKTTNLDGTTSKVYVVDYTATTMSSGIVLGNYITVDSTATTETVEEWYVKYTGTGVNFAKTQETVANVTGTSIKYTLGLPTGVASITYAGGGSTGITTPAPAYSTITSNTEYSTTLQAKDTAPVIRVATTGSSYAVTLTADKAVKGAGVSSVVIPSAAASQAVAASGTTSTALDVSVALTDAAPSSAEVRVTYKEGNTEKTKQVAVRGTAATVTLDPVTVGTAGVSVVVTKVEVLVPVTFADITSGATNLTGTATVAVSNSAGALTTGTLAVVGETLTVNVTAAAADITGTGVIFTVDGVAGAKAAAGVAANQNFGFVPTLTNGTISATVANA